jgi:predicted PurR-regulated permease PerM
MHPPVNWRPDATPSSSDRHLTGSVGRGSLLHGRQGTLASVTEQRALAWLAALAIVAIGWLALPFATGLLLGAVLAFSLEPLYRRLVRRTGRPSLTSILLVIATGIVIVAAIAGFASQFVSRTVDVANAVREQLRDGGTLARWIDVATRWLGRFGISAASLTERLQSGLTGIASGVATVAGTLASRSLSALIGTFFALLGMHVVLRHWPRIVSLLVRISPLDADYTRTLLEDFRRVGRTTASGTVLTGLAQGSLAAIGYGITGVPSPIFLGVATAVASLLPAVGTLLVWVPVGLYLFATDHPARAIIELIWGALVVVAFSDYVIRPRLVREEGMPALLVFISLFGGLEVMGLSGLVAGPIVMALALTVLRLYAREAGRQP